jgi:hypothetical protein
MRLAHAVLILADISGYTDFITNREVSLLHAEQIITDLLESMIDRTEHPLVLNKLEGDAAFLYAESGSDPAAAVRDAMSQVRTLFAAFGDRLERIRVERSNCSCDACANIGRLKLKAFAHCGEIAIKQVRQFEEVAGEDVILVHRLMKNHLAEREYVLLSDAITRAWPLPAGTGRRHAEPFEGLGELALTVLTPADLAAATGPAA